MQESVSPDYIGEWIKRRRKALDLSQLELAQRAGCTVSALRKIEGGERRPSKQLAGLLAKALEIPSEDLTTFIRIARGELSADRLSLARPAVPLVYRPPDLPGTSAGNLPGMLTPFIGREPELVLLSQLFHDPHCRMLTLLGPGGIGKTRLAIEVATRHKDLFPDGIWFVPLSPLNSTAFLVPAIADALNFKCHGLTNPRSQLLNYLSNKKILLILDNVEHLLEGVELFTEILENSPHVKLLVTSRERLNLLSEWIYETQGLPVPPDSQIEKFKEYSSVALFLQTARRIRFGYELQDDEYQWVARICQIMEGMPLGIELAAAWVGVLSCEEIAREIEHNLDFLEVSTRDIASRHRSLRATLDHSWNLLNRYEKVILSRLSVFRGSFTRESAEEICGANLIVLSSLKDKSLLRYTDRGYYDLHELIRQYAAVRLAEDASDYERLLDQHAIYFAQRLSEWEKAIKSSKQTETLSIMAHEIDNLRQAWQRMVTCCELNCQTNPVFSLELFRSSLFSLSLFFEMRCRNWEAINLFGESMECLKSARDSFDKTEEKQYFETVLGHIITHLGLHYTYILQYQKAEALLEEALSLLGSDQARVERAQAQIMLAWIYQAQGQILKSAALLEQNLSIFQEEGDTWWYTLALARLAWDYLSTGNIQESQSLYQKGLELAEPGDLRLGIPLRTGLARVNYLQNNYLEAEQLLKENLGFCFQLGFKRQTALCYLDLGQVALAANQVELAENNFQECINLLSEFGESLDLALGLIYSSKCLIARLETIEARKRYLQVIQIGKSLDIPYLVYWSLVNLARVHLLSSQPGKAYEIALFLSHYSVEVKVVQEDWNNLIAELNTRLSPQQMDAIIDQTERWSSKALIQFTETIVQAAPDFNSFS